MFTKFTLSILFFCISILNIFITYEMYTDLATYFKYAVISFPVYYLIFLFLGSYKILHKSISFSDLKEIRKESTENTYKKVLQDFNKNNKDIDNTIRRIHLVIKTTVLCLMLATFKLIMYFFV